jgi:hypothetical protein
VHVTLRIQIGSYSYTFAWRLYLREKTVRRLNRKRPKEKRLRFKSKYRLAREMLEELRALLPEGYTVYVLFDRWYGSGKLIKFILYWLLDSSMRILPSEWSILRKPGIMLINAKTYLESRNRMIETIIDAWKQLVNHLKQLVKHYTKPLTSGLVISALSDTTRSRVDLIAENALLRQQLIILKRQVKRPLLTQPERTRLVLLARCTRFWQQALHIVQPDTLLRWHRDLFRRYWRRKSRNKKPKPRIPAETIALIKQMTRENRLWGRNASGENC